MAADRYRLVDPVQVVEVLYSCSGAAAASKHGCDKTAAGSAS